MKILALNSHDCYVYLAFAAAASIQKTHNAELSGNVLIKVMCNPLWPAVNKDTRTAAAYSESSFVSL